MMHTCSITYNAVAKGSGSIVAHRAHNSSIVIVHRVHNSSIDIAQHRAATDATDVLQQCSHTATLGAEAVHLRYIPQRITIVTNVTATANLRCRHL